MADLVGSLLGGIGLGGNTIGAAVVRLRLDSDDYNRQLATANAQTTTAANSMGTTTSRFSSLASTAFLGAGVAAAAFGVFAVKAAVEANDAMNKLQNSLENNPRLAGESAQSFVDLADEIRQLTGVDDEAIIASQALLAQFKLTGEEIRDLTPLVVDLSAKMGIDLDAAAKAVGKATQGSTGILSRYGIVLDETAVEADAFKAVHEGLTETVGGFAQQRGIDEPWRILISSFEEIAEKVGQSLLPAIQGIASALEGMLPIIERVADAFKFLPLAQVGEDLKEVQERTEAGGAGWKDYADLVIDTVPILGHFIDISGGAKDALEDNVNIITHISDVIRGRYIDAITIAGNRTSRFAGLTVKELNQWQEDIGESIEDAIFDLKDLSDEADITKREFVKAHKEMLREAVVLASTLDEIRSRDWVNEKYLKFLADEGPGALVAFGKLTDEKAREQQDRWLETARILDRDVKGGLEKLTDKLREMDNGKSQHTVIIDYEYRGFDPSKPGMGGANTSNNTPSETRRP